MKTFPSNLAYKDLWLLWIGEKTGTSAVFNLSTQFGGGKTHALTLLYHLAKHGSRAAGWTGVSKILEVAEQKTIPEAAVAVFVGTEFDPVTGRGGADGTPLRMTPWGEIAFQLGGAEALKVLEKHEQQLTAPAGDVIRGFLPKDKPVVILMDELMNFISRSRRSGMAAQLYSFLQNLSEEARGRDTMILAVSIPASELEMNAEDQADYERIKKLLDRLGKAVMMAAESETAEIIRRRLFEWDQKATSADGKILLSREAHQTCQEFADWVREHRPQLPGWFSSDNAREAFLATYPFHPAVLSVFERKWQSLPRFQQTRGVLRLLALWVSRAYQDGFKGGHRDPLIGLGTAPLEETQKRLLAESLKKAERDLKESVWRCYKYIFLLGKDNKLKTIDLGLVHSSAADSPVSVILNRLRQDGEVEPEISPNFLVRNWPSALEEWSTKSVRDAFFASPLFPRLLVPDAVKSTIARGVENGLFAYCGKIPGGSYEPFIYKTPLTATDIELSEDVCLIRKEAAEAHRRIVEQEKEATKPKPAEHIAEVSSETGNLYGPAGKSAQSEPPPAKSAKSMTWRGEVPPQKWMNFYMKILSKFAVAGGLKLKVTAEVSPQGGVTALQAEETRQALRELGLQDSVDLD